MSGPGAVSTGLKKAGGLSFIAVALLQILSIPLSLASAAVLLPSSTLAGIQALQGLTITYGTWVGTLIALELFAVVGFGSLYFVLRGTRQLGAVAGVRSEEHTSELQSRPHLVCRLLLEKKKHSPTLCGSDC